jgi:hypothetical protein
MALQLNGILSILPLLVVIASGVVIIGASLLSAEVATT